MTNENDNKRLQSLDKELEDLSKKRDELRRKRDDDKGIETHEWFIYVALVVAVNFVVFILSKDINFVCFDETFFVKIFAISIPAMALIIIGHQALDKAKYSIKVRKLRREIANVKSEKLQENIGADFFSMLIKINFKYIDKYYFQTQTQAEKSFAVALGVGIIAFGLIGVGITLLFSDHKSNLQAATIVTIAGLLSEFISAVFFYLFNKTVVKMGEYHHKLVLTQNISLALKVTEGIKNEDEKTKAQSLLIGELVKNINQHLASRPDDSGTKS